MFIILILQAIVKMSAITDKTTPTTPPITTDTPFKYQCICGSGVHFHGCTHNNKNETGIPLLSKEQLFKILEIVKTMCAINNICFYHWLRNLNTLLLQRKLQ